MACSEIDNLTREKRIQIKKDNLGCIFYPRLDVSYNDTFNGSGT